MTTLSSHPSVIIRAIPILALVVLVPGLGLAQRSGLSGSSATPGQSNPGQRAGGAGAAEPQRSQPRSDALLAWEWWKDEAVKKEMGLTDLQVRQISRVYDERSRQAKPFADEYGKQLDELERMTRERQVDTATYSLQVTRCEALRTKLNETRFVMLYSFYRMLTPEQYDKLREIRDRRRTGRGGH